MVRCARQCVLVLFLVALSVPKAGAQPVARTFADLRTLLASGDYVFVIDRADRETWGRVTEVSESTVTIVRVLKQEGTERLEITSERLVFTELTVGLLLRSDASGRRGDAIYPPSWNAVDALPSGADVTVVLSSGERRPYRLLRSDAERLQLQTAAGESEILDKRQVVRLERNGVDDSPVDGTILGALIGAGTGLGLMAVAYATTCETCDAPEPGPMFLAAGSFSAGIGAFTGWLIDRLHKGKEVVYPAVAPILAREKKGVALTVRF
jgi:hypothetical protein